MNFTYQPYPVRVVFGQPLYEALASENHCNRDQNLRLWVIATSRFDDVISQITSHSHIKVVNRCSDVVQHVPEDLVHKIIRQVTEDKPDVILSVGGGSAVGLAKAVALETALPVWAAPTTYSGSEMTNIYGISSDGKKEVGRANKVLPKIVFYDPDLSKNLPLKLATQSAMNAMAHLVEALYSPAWNPFSYQSALHGMGVHYKGMQQLVTKGKLSTEINKKLLLGGCLSGKVLCEVNMGLHHKAAHVLGGNFGMDHASVHTVLLPYVLEHHWEHLKASLQRDFKSALHASYPPAALRALSVQAGVPVTLRDLGLALDNISSAAEQIAAKSFDSHAPVQAFDIQNMLKNAWHGKLHV